MWPGASEAFKTHCLTEAANRDNVQETLNHDILQVKPSLNEEGKYGDESRGEKDGGGGGTFKFSNRLSQCEGDFESIRAVTSFVDGKLLASALRGSTSRLWDSPTEAAPETPKGNMFSANADQRRGRPKEKAKDEGGMRFWSMDREFSIPESHFPRRKRSIEGNGDTQGCKRRRGDPGGCTEAAEDFEMGMDGMYLWIPDERIEDPWVGDLWIEDVRA